MFRGLGWFLIKLSAVPGVTGSLGLGSCRAKAVTVSLKMWPLATFNAGCRHQALAALQMVRGAEGVLRACFVGDAPEREVDVISVFLISGPASGAASGSGRPTTGFRATRSGSGNGRLTNIFARPAFDVSGERRSDKPVTRSPLSLNTPDKRPDKVPIHIDLGCRAVASVSQGLVPIAVPGKRASPIQSFQTCDVNRVACSNFSEKSK